MFTVDLKDEAVTAALMRASAVFEDLTPLFKNIGEILVESTKARFPKGIAPDGSAWAPKSATTLAKYGARKSNRVDIRPLFGPSGTLWSQIFHVAGPDGVEIGSARSYAAVMQFGAAKGAFGTTRNGSPIPWGDIPARPYLGLSEEDRVNITGQIADWMAGAFAAP